MVLDASVALRRSQNAYVAHYVALRSLGEIDGDFAAYVEDFGLAGSLRTASFEVARTGLMAHLERRYAGYGVSVMVVRSSPEHRTRAEQALTFALRERGDEERPTVLVTHDTQVVAWLFAGEADAAVVRVLSTWDGSLFHPHDRERPAWEVRTDGEVTLRGVSSAVLAATDHDAERGARIWDLLVSIEQSGWKGAALRRQAMAFKNDCARRSAADPRRAEVQRAWAAWKGGSPG